MSEQGSDELDLVPELGDFITILSEKYTKTTGRIVYRDETLLRVRPVNSFIVVDFPIGEDGEFDPLLGITNLIIKEKRKDPHFSKQLNTVVGDEIELIDAAGKSLGRVGKVIDIIATDDMDAIRLDNNKYLNFRFIGAKKAIGVVIPHSQVLSENVEQEQEEGLTNTTVPPIPEFEFDPTVVVYEETEEDQYTFSDSVQRQDMFTAFMDDIPTKRQADPKTIQSIYRTTDVFLALKNSLVVRDGNGAIKVGVEPRSYIVNTVQDAMKKQPSGYPISGILPVANVKKTLFMDIVEENDSFSDKDVALQNDLVGLFQLLNNSKKFENSQSKEPGFLPYIYSVFKSVSVFEPVRQEEEFIEMDQDVLRSKLPPENVDGIPIVPVFQIKGEVQLLQENSIGFIENRYVRLLGPSRTKIVQKTESSVEMNYIVAPADTADTVANILLSQNMLSYRQPTRSSVLIWDIQSSEQSRANKMPFYDMLMKDWKNQRILRNDDSLTNITDVIEERIQPNVSFINYNYTSTLDSLGVRNLELSEEIYKSLKHHTSKAQTAWVASFTKLRDDSRHSLVMKPAKTFHNITSLRSNLFSTKGNQSFIENLEEFQEKYKYSTLSTSDIVLANELSQAQAYSFYQLWHSLVGEAPSRTIARCEMEYGMEKERQIQKTKQVRNESQKFTATPNLNNCDHVKKYEQIARVKDDEKRMILLNKFIKQYNGGKQDNYVSCNVCKKDLACMHEMYLLNEFFHIGKKEVLHKALLLDFAGPVFEGNYICKVCGQKIREIDYDTSLEFDDEGRPLVGRGIVETEGEEEGITIPLRDESKENQADFLFKGDNLLHYQNIHAVFEACGMEIDMETQSSIYSRSVESLRVFHNFLPSEEIYERKRVVQLGKQKSAKDRADFQQQFPVFKQYYANAMIGFMGAIAVIELQTSSIFVPNPVRSCEFLLQGYPIESEGSGTIDYVTCALQTKKISGNLWSNASWSLETSDKKIKAGILDSIVFALDVIFQRKKVPALSSLTEIYVSRITNAQSEKKHDLPSNKDTLPASFRPLQRLRDVPILEEEPIKNVKTLEYNVRSSEFGIVAPKVWDRQHQLNESILASFHAFAKKDTVENTNNPRSDSSCRFRRLDQIYSEGNGYNSIRLDLAKQKEIDLVNHSQQILQRSDPTAAANGTHVFVPWSSVIRSKLEPELDATLLYQLFLKHCFRGNFIGLNHEIGKNYACRRCHFKYPKELQYLTSAEISESNSKKLEQAIHKLMTVRENVILKSFQEQDVVINEESFRNLETIVRKRKILPEITQDKKVELLTQLQAMDTLLEDVSDATLESWGLFKATIQKAIEKSTYSELDRRIAFASFSTKYDEVLQSVSSSLTEMLTNAKEKSKIVKANVDLAIEGFLQATKEATGQSVRNIMQVFVVGAQQIASGHSNIKPISKKWFPKINPNHAKDLDRIWLDNAEITVQTLEHVEKLDEPTKNCIRSIMNTFSLQFGKWLKVWLFSLKPERNMTSEECVLVLRWSSLSFLQALMEEHTPFYMEEDEDSLDVLRNAQVVIKRWVLQSLQFAKRNIEKYQLTEEQMQNAIFAREEKERNFFINKIDVLDDSMRKIELIKKQLKLGDWNVSSKNLFSYNRDWWEHEREQRAAMGIVPDFGEHVSGAIQEEHGLEQSENKMEDVNDHRVKEDED